jgi:hypothetical protein
MQAHAFSVLESSINLAAALFCCVFSIHAAIDPWTAIVKCSTHCGCAAPLVLQVVESCLMATLPEHLNAEIVLGTVKDISQAIAWIRSTFLFTRVRANPQHYG